MRSDQNLRKLFVLGDDGLPACVVVDDYGDKVLADVESEYLTESSFRAVIETEFPGVQFRVWSKAKFWFATGKREVTQ